MSQIPVDNLAITIILDLRREDVETLKSQLLVMANAIASKSSPFNDLKGTHFCRFLLLPENIELEIGPQLAFESNYDFDLNDHLCDLTQPSILPDLIGLFSCCVGFPKQGATKHTVQNFIRQNSHKVDTFYRGHRGFSVDLIHKERELNKAIQNHLNGLSGLKQMSPQAIHSSLKKAVKLWFEVPEIHLKHVDLTTFLRRLIWQSLLGLLAFLGVLIFAFSLKVALLVLLVILLVVALLATSLRRLEKTAEQLNENERGDNYKEITKWANEEDLIVQNQLTHMVPLAKGWLRKQFQKVALAGLNILSINVFNQGKLGDISSIHFARWSMINDGKRLLFFSNFDGTWENYLGDFVDRAARGLTLAWSNTFEFPRSRWLVLDGATDEERFKIWARKYQVNTQVWYSAYKDLTVKNIYQNHDVALGFQKDNLTEIELIDWLKKIS